MLWTSINYFPVNTICIILLAAATFVAGWFAGRWSINSKLESLSGDLKKSKDSLAEALEKNQPQQKTKGK